MLSPKGICEICNKNLYFFPVGIKDHTFCFKHALFFKKNTWEEVKTFIFKATDEKAATLENLKYELYKKYSLPIIQQFNYKEEKGELLTVTTIFTTKKYKSLLSLEIEKNLH